MLIGLFGIVSMLIKIIQRFDAADIFLKQKLFYACASVGIVQK